MANGNGRQSETVSQSEINGILWKACDTFRGAVDPSEYKNYILVMLFVKYISDVWQDHYDKVKAEFGENEERLLRRLKRERFVLPPTCTFQALYDQRNATNVGEIINTALDAIEDANKEKLEGVFRNIDFNSEASLGQTKERNNRLKSLLEDFSDPKLDLRPSRVGTMDVIGNAYEYLIGKFAAGAGKKAGEFYTPPEVSQLIAQLVDPKPGERICDPACGSGSLLIKCGQQVGSKDFSLWGQENIGATWAANFSEITKEDSIVPMTIPTGRYRHYKGKEYTVVGVARHSENQEQLVTYRQEYGDHGLWVRPLKMFLDTVQVDGRVIPQFQHLGE